MARFDHKGRPVPAPDSSYASNWPARTNRATRPRSRARIEARAHRGNGTDDVAAAIAGWIAARLPANIEGKNAASLLPGLFFIFFIIASVFDDDEPATKPAVSGRPAVERPVTTPPVSATSGTTIISALQLDRLQSTAPQALNPVFASRRIIVEGRVAGTDAGEAGNDILYFEASPPIALDVGEVERIGRFSDAATIKVVCSGGDVFEGRILLFDCHRFYG
ncbi:hypothetical protein [Sphingomicrobium aestuariivivum]|uniref:hypothetical protein n=1 Tax=Sphingomicrobium aestuariivivum TaxID=1582356 RepID=UPI001FD6360C|nr:hypothetical protein [Sphingomicrobium aestuariivivum]MCJ8190691.1 hypothetical protein [Sphingomicrobium aestuariivivum]